MNKPCQPAGTLVRKSIKRADRWHSEHTEDVPIESLNVNDRLICLRMDDRQYTKGRAITNIAVNPIEDTLIRVTMDNLTSLYTPSTPCLVSFKSHVKKHVIYLMKRGNQCRIGRSRINYGSQGSGPLRRACAEGADSLWLLSMHDTTIDAIIAEQIASAKYSIPQMLWTVTNVNTTTQKQLDNAWYEIGDNWERGQHCLKAHNRNPSYPIWSTVDPLQKHISLKRATITYASNIMDGCLMLPYIEGNVARMIHWKPITIDRVSYKGLGYSLTVEKDPTYIADGILTLSQRESYNTLA